MEHFLTAIGEKDGEKTLKIPRKHLHQKERCLGGAAINNIALGSERLTLLTTCDGAFTAFGRSLVPVFLRKEGYTHEGRVACLVFAVCTFRYGHEGINKSFCFLKEVGDAQILEPHTSDSDNNREVTNTTEYIVFNTILDSKRRTRTRWFSLSQFGGAVLFLSCFVFQVEDFLLFLSVCSVCVWGTKTHVFSWMFYWRCLFFFPSNMGFGCHATSWDACITRNVSFNLFLSLHGYMVTACISPLKFNVAVGLVSSHSGLGRYGDVWTLGCGGVVVVRGRSFCFPFRLAWPLP